MDSCVLYQLDGNTRRRSFQSNPVLQPYCEAGNNNKEEIEYEKKT